MRLTLGGTLESDDERDATGPQPARADPMGGPLLPADPARAGRVAIGCLIGGIGLLTAAETGWAHAIGVVLLLSSVAAGFLAAAPALLHTEP